MRKITTLAVVLALLASFSPIAAARTVAPPGNSEADQYYETVPGASGPRAPGSREEGENAVGEGRLDSGTARALRRRGAIGVAAASAIARTAASRVERGEGGAKGGPAGAGLVQAPAERGLGDLFVPLLLTLAVAGAAFFAVRRGRRPARK